MLVAVRGQAVQFLGGGQLDGLHALVGRGAADDKGDMVGRAGGRAQVFHLLDQELVELVRGQQRLGLLVEHGLVGGAAALGHEDELVVVAVGGQDVDLGRQVGAGVDLLVHVQGHGLGVAQVFLGVGLVDALGEPLLVLDAGPDLLPFLGGHGGGAGVLADRQVELGGDLGVAQEGQGHALVVHGGLGVAEDLGDLLVVGRTQEEGDIAHGLIGQDRERLGADPDDVLVGEFLHHDIFFRALYLAVGGLVLAEWERVLIHEGFGGHALLSFQLFLVRPQGPCFVVYGSGILVKNWRFVES